MTIVYNCPAFQCDFRDRGKGEVCPKHKLKVVATIKEHIPQRHWIEVDNIRKNSSKNLKDVI